MGIRFSDLTFGAQWKSGAETAPSRYTDACYERSWRLMEERPLSIRDVMGASLRGWKRIRVYALIERLTQLAEDIKVSTESWDASQSFMSDETGGSMDLLLSVSLFEYEASVETLRRIVTDVLETDEEILIGEVEGSNVDFFHQYASLQDRCDESGFLESSLTSMIRYALRPFENYQATPDSIAIRLPSTGSPKVGSPRVGSPRGASSPLAQRMSSPKSRLMREYEENPMESAVRPDPSSTSVSLHELYYRIPDLNLRTETNEIALQDFCHCLKKHFQSRKKTKKQKPQMEIGDVLAAVILTANCSDLERRNLMFLAFDTNRNGMLEEAEMKMAISSSIRALITLFGVNTVEPESSFSNTQLLQRISWAAFYDCDSKLLTDGHVTYSEFSEWIRGSTIASYALNAFARTGLFENQSWVKFKIASKESINQDKSRAPCRGIASVQLTFPQAQTKEVEKSYHQENYGKDEDGVIRAGLASSRHKQRLKFDETIRRQREKQKKHLQQAQSPSRQSLNNKSSHTGSMDHNQLKKMKRKALILFDVFVDLDKDDTGLLTSQEWLEGLQKTNKIYEESSHRSVSSGLHDEVIQQLLDSFQKVDKNFDQVINFEELLDNVFARLDKETKRRIHNWARTDAIQRRRKGLPAGGFAKEYKRTHGVPSQIHGETFTEIEQQQLRQIFNGWDVSKNGVLSKGELVQVMTRTGLFSLDEAVEEFRKIKPSGRDYITFEEFKGHFGEVILAVSPYKEQEQRSGSTATMKKEKMSSPGR